MIEKFAHTPGPWRWELNESTKELNLVGGVPMFDLTIISPTRWGMHSATLLARDTAIDGMNVMSPLHERREWVAPYEGREHHARWCMNVVHPDMLLIAASPDLLKALQGILAVVNVRIDDSRIAQFDAARAAIAKATGKTSEAA